MDAPNAATPKPTPVETEITELPAAGRDDWWFGRREFGLSRTVLRAAVTLSVVLALLGAGLAWFSPKPESRGHPLRFSFSRGHDYRFRLVGQFEGTETIGSTTSAVHQNVTALVTWHVLSVDDQGVATVRATVARISDRVNGKQRRVRSTTDRIQISPDGKILAAGSNSLSKSGGAGTILLGLQQVMPPLPTGLVNPGDTWDVSFVQPVGDTAHELSVRSAGSLVQYNTVDHSTTAVVRSEMHMWLDFAESPASLLGARAASKLPRHTSFLWSGRESGSQTSWVDPVGGNLIESTTLAQVDVRVQMTGGSEDSSRAAAFLTGIKGAFTLEVMSLPIRGSGSRAARDRAADRVARESLRRGLATADLFFAAGHTFAGFSPARVAGLATSLRWREGTRALRGWITIRRSSATTILLAARSASGTTFCVARTPTGARYGRTNAKTALACRGGW